MRNILAAIAAAGALAACAGPDKLEVIEANYPAYTINSGDTLRVVVARHESISGEYIVTDTGVLKLPLIGSVEAEGETSASLGERVEELAIERGVFVNPDVTVAIVQV